MVECSKTHDIVPAAGVILFRRHPPVSSIEFLLIQSRSGKFGAPKGHVEKLETVFEAAIRETFEETGLKEGDDFCVIPDFNCNVRYEVNNTRDGQKIKDITLWLGEVINRNCQVTTSSEHRGYKWVQLDEVIFCLGERPGFKDYISSFEKCVKKIHSMLD